MGNATIIIVIIKEGGESDGRRWQNQQSDEGKTCLA
jgi:hypothetical protein